MQGVCCRWPDKGGMLLSRVTYTRRYSSSCLSAPPRGQSWKAVATSLRWNKSKPTCRDPEPGHNRAQWEACEKRKRSRVAFGPLLIGEYRIRLESHKNAVP